MILLCGHSELPAVMISTCRALKDAWFLQVKVLSGKTPEYPVAYSSREEISARAARADSSTA